MGTDITGKAKSALKATLRHPTTFALMQIWALTHPAIGAPVNALYSTVRTMMDHMAEERQYTFFEELDNRGTIKEEDLEKPEFVHAFLTTSRAVINTQQAEKIRMFARLLASYAAGRGPVTNDEYEEALGILNDLSLREFKILVILYRFETNKRGSRGWPKGRTGSVIKARSFWGDFIKAVVADLKIPKGEILGILERLKRTGLYRSHIVGDLDPETGYLTPNFYSFIKALEITGYDLDSSADTKSNQD